MTEDMETRDEDDIKTKYMIKDESREVRKEEREEDN